MLKLMSYCMFDAFVHPAGALYTPVPVCIDPSRTIGVAKGVECFFAIYGVNTLFSS